MITIIKNGNPGRRVKLFYEKECVKCGCVFEFNEEDIKTNSYYDKTIKCPCCNSSLSVDIENSELREVK